MSTKISALPVTSGVAATDRIPSAVSPFGSTNNAYFTPDHLDTYLAQTTKTLINKTLTSPVITGASISTSTWSGNVIDLAVGGTNANLTAANGGILYSTTTALAILAPTVTAGQMLRSGASAAPTWSTVTFPNTAAAGSILNASSTNVLGATVTPTLGVAGSSTGTLSFSGVTSGVVTIQPQSAAGTFNFNLPTTAGTTGFFLTSGGGGASPMTWSNGSQIIGTATNDNANAGNIGELIESRVARGSAVSLSSNVTANVTSISLTAGDWDVWGAVGLTANGTTSFTRFDSAISTTSATFPTFGASGGDAYARLNTAAIVPASTIDFIFPLSPIRMSLSGTTTVYLINATTFSASTTGAYGYIGARRRR